MFRLFWPLALSSLLMGTCSLVVAAGVGRLPDAATALAAIGVVSGLAILVESPVIAVLSTTIALADSRPAAERVWRGMAALGVLVTLLMWLAFFTPLSDVITRGLLGLPDPVAEAAGPALRLMLPWPVAIGWRRYYQGLLIRAGHTAVIGWATLGRLLATAVVAFAVGPLLTLPGATVGALALAAGVVAEAVIITPPGWRAERRLPLVASGLTYGDVWRYHRPLAASHLMRVAVQPFVSGALARGVLPTISLAAWPLVGSTALLLASAVVPLQEIAIATVRDAATEQRVRRFTWQVGLALTVCLVVLATTPLLDLYLRAVLGAPADVRPAAAAAVLWLLPTPLLLAWQAAQRGLLAARRRTGLVATGMAVNLVVLVGWLLTWIGVGLGPGVVGAATATVAATAAEVALLAWLQRAGAGRA